MAEHDMTHHESTHHEHDSCVDVCNECADACDHCASACLREADPKMMSRCIALDIDCAAICRLAAGVMARDSEHAQAVCAVCADICESCAEECGKHPMDHCQQCAQACRRCAEECRRMSQQATGRQSRGSSAPL